MSYNPYGGYAPGMPQVMPQGMPQPEKSNAGVIIAIVSVFVVVAIIVVVAVVYMKSSSTVVTTPTPNIPATNLTIPTAGGTGTTISTDSSGAPKVEIPAAGGSGTTISTDASGAAKVDLPATTPATPPPPTKKVVRSAIVTISDGSIVETNFYDDNSSEKKVHPKGTEVAFPDDIKDKTKYATVFTNPNMTGISCKMTIGEYPNLADLGYPINSTTSLSMNGGVVIILNTGANFSGEQCGFSGPVSNLHNGCEAKDAWPYKIAQNGKWDDRAVSIKIGSP